MNKLMVVSAMVVLAAGCTSVKITREGAYNDAALKMSDRSCNPYHLDWDVSPNRVSGTGVSTCWFWFFSSSDGRSYAAPGFTFDGGVTTAKNSAMFDAVEKAKCDALVGCMYRTTKTSVFFGIYKETMSEVKGFPAKVKSVDFIKDYPVLIDKDKQVIRVNNWENLGTPSAPCGGNVDNPAARPKKRFLFF